MKGNPVKTSHAIRPRLFRDFAGWLAAATVLAGSLAAAAAEPTNLVTNGSLEEPVGAEGWPPGWGRFYPCPDGCYRTSLADGGRTGEKEMRIDYVAGEGAFGAMPANRVPLDRTRRYVARGYVKVTGGQRATADVKLHYYGPGGEYLGQTRIGFAVPGRDDWQLVTVTDRAAEFPQASQIGLAVACTGDAKARYDDLELLAFEKESLPPDFELRYGVTRSPEQALLDRRVGTWDVKSTIKPCIWMPNGAESTSVETVRWSLLGQLLEGRIVDTQVGGESLSLWAYDGRDRVYRAWFFDTYGNLPRTESIGRWDAATETFTFEADQKDEFHSVVRLKLSGNDETRWHGVWKDKDSRVLLEIEGTARRRKEARP